jgi:DNA topoisomerase II
MAKDLKLTVSDFFNNDYIQYAMYDSYRSCANYIDGMKPTARKIVHVINKNNVTTPMKISVLGSKLVEECAYLHGEGSGCGVAVNMAQNFVGSNNINLLEPKGSFGNRFINQAAAARYIYTCKSKWFDKFFNKDDYPSLIKQSFEGEQIEPKFYMPIVPLLLINGSEGIGNGYAQKILPRNVKDIITFIKDVLKDGKSTQKLIPYYNGFKGKVKVNDEGQIKIYGAFERVNPVTIRITEIPVYYDLDSYVQVLIGLKEEKIIKSFKDYSDNDVFKFEVLVDRETGKMTDDELLNMFKLVKTITENFTCIDENNSIREFNNVYEVIVAYIKVRLEFYKKRKEYLISKLKEELTLLMNRVYFIKGVIEGTIIINKKSKDNIEAQLKKMNFNKINDSYDYLLNMPIYSLTKEKIEELFEKSKAKKKELNEICSQKIQDMWLLDLKTFE